jgi:hypothetical protein
VEESRRTVRRLELQIDALERARKSYLAQWRAFTERQATELRSAEETPPPERPALTDGAGETAKEKAPSWLDEGGHDEEDAK